MSLVKHVVCIAEHAQKLEGRREACIDNIILCHACLGDGD